MPNHSKGLHIILRALEKNRSSFPRTSATKEFHISKEARDSYAFDELIFSSTGNAILPNFHASRVLAEKMNRKRDLAQHPEKAVRAGAINAMGLIDEILHHVIDIYLEQNGRGLLSNALETLSSKVGEQNLQKTFVEFCTLFPPLAVYKGQVSVETYLRASTNGVPNRELILEEMIMLWCENANPAFAPYKELFDDAYLAEHTQYRHIIEEIQTYFKTLPPFGPHNQDLITLLRSPALAFPDSLAGQIGYIRERWGMLLGTYLFRLLSSLDFMKEEEKPFFLGPGPTKVFEYKAHDMEEYERFSQDREWMPKLVLIAKSTLVWLDQLSKKYGFHVSRLDQIPDQELDMLADQGFTGLWLIGIWQRSPASRRIKQLCGNPEAEASAYSLYDYEIAQELGGWEALIHLKNRCWLRGIRLASDMVPNHTGVESKWVIEHPDWFIQTKAPPFPSYTFEGENLSHDSRVGIQIEDHYYNRSDAAVVFKRTDFWTGDARYIYHGNDGTHMPWNDTAQLNFLLPEVREAVMNTIIHVAKTFPIIRFDAAMTLTKKHFQRLWFPEPGTGGDIPSRAEHGMQRDDFNRCMPQEFWREVVDRIAEEAPDTLLLAEAFWLMEGYFVRTLGMHRVYNSAFMNMLKNEENEKYRKAIRNTLEFDPEILKRFVNFMNNPDEETAIDQFGTGDKYFGICTMMVTMPGLPMFGHGQIEGFKEKYGMEYRKAYWNEQPNQSLIDRHYKEIFPLMKKRYLFAEVKNFLFFDVFNHHGAVNEHVFAYLNRSDSESVLVVYNNSLHAAKGWIHTSVPFLTKNDSGEKQIVTSDLAQGIGLVCDEDCYCVLHEFISGFYYLRASKEISQNGLYFELAAYQCQIFLNIREVRDNEQHHYRLLHAELGGRGTRDLDESLKEIFLKPVLEAFKEAINSETISGMCRDFEKKSALNVTRKKRILKAMKNFYKSAKAFSKGEGSPEGIVASISRDIDCISDILMLKNSKHSNEGSEPLFSSYIMQGFADFPETLPVLCGWALLRHLGEIIEGNKHGSRTQSLLREWLLGKKFAYVLAEMGFPAHRAQRTVEALGIAFEQTLPIRTHLASLFTNNDILDFIGENRYAGIRWYNKEGFEELLWWLFVFSLISSIGKMNRAEMVSLGNEFYARLELLFKAEAQSEYHVEKLITYLALIN